MNFPDSIVLDCVLHVLIGESLVAQQKRRRKRGGRKQKESIQALIRSEMEKHRSGPDLGTDRRFCSES